MTYRDDRNKDKVLQFLGQYYRSTVTEELEETRRAYIRLTPGLPVVTAKSVENVIVNDRDLAPMGLKAEDMLDLSFLQRLEQEKKARWR